MKSCFIRLSPNSRSLISYCSSRLSFFHVPSGCRVCVIISASPGVTGHRQCFQWSFSGSNLNGSVWPSVSLPELLEPILAVEDFVAEYAQRLSIRPPRVVGKPFPLASVLGIQWQTVTVRLILLFTFRSGAAASFVASRRSIERRHQHFPELMPENRIHRELHFVFGPVLVFADIGLFGDYVLPSPRASRWLVC